MKSINVFLPHISSYQIEQLDLLTASGKALTIKPLTQDWQQRFCAEVGYKANDLPWTRLRMAQFHLADDVKVACCCDPVLMRLNPNGAHMLGQSQLQLSHNDAIQIVAQINERLMSPHENLYLIDKHAWLYTSTKELSLQSPPLQQLIGKDMFNFSYAGDDEKYWQQLSSEIQMLLKQMVDYQGLIPPPAETMMSVHFSDLEQLENCQPIPFINNDKITLVTDNELIKTFCASSFLSQKPLAQISAVETDSCVVVALDDERESYSDIINNWLEIIGSHSLVNAQIICQDASISLNQVQKMPFWKRLFGVDWLNKNKYSTKSKQTQPVNKIN